MVKKPLLNSMIDNKKVEIRGYFSHLILTIVYSLWSTQKSLEYLRWEVLVL